MRLRLHFFIPLFIHHKITYFTEILSPPGWVQLTHCTLCMTVPCRETRAPSPLKYRFLKYRLERPKASWEERSPEGGVGLQAKKPWQKTQTHRRRMPLMLQTFFHSGTSVVSVSFFCSSASSSGVSLTAFCCSRPQNAITAFLHRPGSS